MPALAKEPIFLQILTNSYETFRFYFIYNLKFLFPEDNFGPGIKQEESCSVLAVIFVVMREFRSFFRLKSLCFPLTQSSLPLPLKPSHVVFKGCKVYHMYLNVLH